ncbi:hypothetical protein LTS01_025397 [Friedmanniomyces endolithicus]|nr:hypothetical protein LTS01_025397 [Friedmanniomyces endolithicus]
MLRMSALGQLVRIKHVPCIALSATRHRPASDRPLKLSGKNWAKALEKRHPELQAKRVKALDWHRHEKNIYAKTAHWFEVIAKVMQDSQVMVENTFNMDETGVMLSMLGSVKVLVGRDDTRDYRGAPIKRTTMTAIECISGNGLLPLPVEDDSATVLNAKLSSYLDVLHVGHSLAAATGLIHGELKLESPETRAMQGMTPNEKDYYEAWKEQRPLLLPSVDWDADRGRTPTSQRPFKKATRRAEALNRIYGVNKAEPCLYIYFTEKYPIRS